MSRFMERGTVPALLRRPWRIPRALQAVAALAPQGWWRRRPFLPLPDDAYWRFRLETSSGGDGTTLPSPEEVVEVVDCLHRMRRQRR